MLGGLKIYPRVANFLRSKCAKNCENWLALDKVIAKIIQAYFFGPPCILVCSYPRPVYRLDVDLWKCGFEMRVPPIRWPAYEDSETYSTWRNRFGSFGNLLRLSWGNDLRKSEATLKSWLKVIF